MEEDDYESLPPTSTVSTHMMAGAAAGIMEHCVMYPVDIVKTRMQSLQPNPNARYTGIFDALYRIVRYEGVKNTMRGINAMVGGAGPAHAMYFAAYEKMKRYLSNPQYQNGTAVTQAMAGACATVLHDAVMNPAEVIKQRMQVYDSPYKTCLECGRTVLKTEGVRAFYRSFTTQLTMNIPFQSLHFIVYEQMQDYLNNERQYNPHTHIISGAIAGAVAAGVTTPLDVCKTLLNTQENCAVNKLGANVSGISQAVRTIYDVRGFRGFFAGMSARVVYQMPSTAISWSVYEAFKYMLTKRNSGAQCDGYVTPSSVQAAVHVHAAASSRS